MEGSQEISNGYVCDPAGTNKIMKDEENGTREEGTLELQCFASFTFSTQKSEVNDSFERQVSLRKGHLLVNVMICQLSFLSY